MIFINHDDLRSKVCFEECISHGLFVSDRIEDMKYADIIYLGKSGLDRKNFLFTGCESEYVDEIKLSQLKKDSIVFTLVYNEYLNELSKKYHFDYIALMNDKMFKEENAILTAEGLIAYLLTHRLNPLYKTRVLVLGYGDCGKNIIKRLEGFECVLSIYSRNLDNYMENNCTFTSQMDELDFSQFDIIINTIPEVIIYKDAIDQMKKSVMIVDIASYPYGIDHHYALNQGFNSIILPSIPNKYAYHYAGIMIYRHLREKSEC